MSNPDIGFVVIEGGLVTAAPDSLPVFNMDTLDTDVVTDDTIADAAGLRDALIDYLAGLDDDNDDRTFLVSLVETCDRWLARHTPTSDTGADHTGLTGLGFLTDADEAKWDYEAATGLSLDDDTDLNN